MNFSCARALKFKTEECEDLGEEREEKTKKEMEGREKRKNKKEEETKQTKTQLLLSSFHIIKGSTKKLQHTRQKE